MIGISLLPPTALNSTTARNGRIGKLPQPVRGASYYDINLANAGRAEQTGACAAGGAAAAAGWRRWRKEHTNALRVTWVCHDQIANELLGAYVLKCGSQGDWKK